MSRSPAEERVESLRRARPRSGLLRGSAVSLLAFGAYAWFSGELAVGSLLAPQRLENLARFLREDALPAPLRGGAGGGAGLLGWLGEVVGARGVQAMLATLWISVLAIVLAGLAALLLAPLGTRTLMSRDPFAVCDAGSGAACSRGPVWRVGCALVRLGFVLPRAVPEYVLAYLLLALFGPTAWPAVLALALHNTGILGRLGADSLEDLEPGPLRSLRMLGAGRRQIVGVGAVPLALPRLLLYFFYRFETCVREATVLGMLGMVSLGYWVLEFRARQRYDEMLVYVALGGGIVVVADLVSQAVRAWIRDES